MNGFLKDILLFNHKCLGLIVFSYIVQKNNSLHCSNYRVKIYGQEVRIDCLALKIYEYKCKLSRDEKLGEGEVWD